MPPLEGRQLLSALAAHCRHSTGGTVAARFGSAGQVFLAPRSCVLPTKHLTYLKGWDCQVHAMFLPPVEVASSVWGENFTSLKGSCWDTLSWQHFKFPVRYETQGLLLRLARSPKIGGDLHL